MPRFHKHFFESISPDSFFKPFSVRFLILTLPSHSDSRLRIIIDPVSTFKIFFFFFLPVLKTDRFEKNCRTFSTNDPKIYYHKQSSSSDTVIRCFGIGRVGTHNKRRESSGGDSTSFEISVISTYASFTLIDENTRKARIKRILLLYNFSFSAFET